MIEDDTPNDDVLANIQGEMKHNRKILIGLVILATITTSILASSAGFLMSQLWNPIEVPSAKFDRDLSGLNESIAKLLKQQQVQSASYDTFQASLEQVTASYSNKAMIDLRMLLAERERDNRKLLSLLGASVGDISLMAPGPKETSQVFRKSIEKLLKESEQREKDLLNAGKGT